MSLKQILDKGIAAVGLSAMMLGSSCNTIPKTSYNPEPKTYESKMYNLGPNPAENAPITDLPCGLEGRIHIVSYDDGMRELSLNLKLIYALNLKELPDGRKACPLYNDFSFRQRETCYVFHNNKVLELYWDRVPVKYYSDGGKVPMIILYMNEHSHPGQAR